MRLTASTTSSDLMTSMSTVEVSPIRPSIVWRAPTDTCTSKPIDLSHAIRFSTCLGSALSLSNMTIRLSSPPSAVTKTALQVSCSAKPFRMPPKIYAQQHALSPKPIKRK